MSILFLINPLKISDMALIKKLGAAFRPKGRTLNSYTPIGVIKAVFLGLFQKFPIASSPKQDLYNYKIDYLEENQECRLPLAEANFLEPWYNYLISCSPDKT